MHANELWCDFFARKGTGWLPVLTGSMAPMIRPGDQVLIAFTGSEQINIGDILLFKRDGELIVHRVLNKWREVRGVYFLEKGDNRYASGIVNASDVIGRVALVKRGNTMLDLTSPSSRITSTALTAWLYLASGIVQLFKRPKNRWLRRAKRFLSMSLLLSSNLLIRVCFIVWYSSGFITKHQKGEQVKQASLPFFKEGKVDWSH